MACAGTKESYWVKGDKTSTFVWTVTDNVGNIMPASFLTPIDSSGGNYKAVQVNWDKNLPGGIYTFSVVEHYSTGVIGEPWDKQNVVLNSLSDFIPFNTISTSYAGCLGDSLKLDPGSGYLGYYWTWNTNSDTNQYIVTRTSGKYTVRLRSSDQSCSYDTTNLTINPLPVIPLGNDTVLFGSQTLSLDVYSSEFVSYKWSTGSNFPSITVDGQSGNQNIWVTVTDIYGCTDTASINISAANYSNLRIPAAFTPNGDAINDKWYFPAPDGATQDLYPYFDNIEVHVFNRWGKLVWESNKNFIAWDGKDLNGNALPMDSYHYVIRLKVEGKTYLYKGSITIIR